MKVQSGDSEVQQLFKLIDRDGDGSITLKEVEKLIKNVGMNKKDFRKYDLRNMINKADAGEKDGKITMDEFEAYLKDF